MYFTKLKYDFRLICSNNQVENMKVNMGDHGTWNKHLTVHQSSYLIPFTLKYCRTYIRFTEHRNLHPFKSNDQRKVPLRIASSPSLS